jgi:hypothetical protein
MVNFVSPCSMTQGWVPFGISVDQMNPETRFLLSFFCWLFSEDHLGHCFQCMHIYIYLCLYLYIDPQNQTFQWTKNDNFNPICSMYGIYINKYPKDDAVVYTVLSENSTSTGYIIKKWPCAWENRPFPSNLNYHMIVGYIYSIISSPLSHFITT